MGVAPVPRMSSHSQQPVHCADIFQNKADAWKAINEGNCLAMDGREFRCEISHARRHITVLRHDGVMVYPNDLFAEFSQFGQIEKIFYDGIAWGWGIRFRCYGSFALAKDAVQSDSTPYILRW